MSLPIHKIDIVWFNEFIDHFELNEEDMLEQMDDHPNISFGDAALTGVNPQVILDTFTGLTPAAEEYLKDLANDGNPKALIAVPK